MRATQTRSAPGRGRTGRSSSLRPAWRLARAFRHRRAQSGRKPFRRPSPRSPLPFRRGLGRSAKRLGDRERLRLETAGRHRGEPAAGPQRARTDANGHHTGALRRLRKWGIHTNATSATGCGFARGERPVSGGASWRRACGWEEARMRRNRGVLYEPQLYGSPLYGRTAATGPHRASKRLVAT
jgi:hypothetical protein